MGETHPLNEERVTRLRGELSRWEKERKLALKKIEKEMSVSLKLEGLRRARMQHWGPSGTARATGLGMFPDLISTSKP
jgi:hypothetical protein